MPQYTTFRSGLGHHPVFTGTVELAGITFTGDPAKNKKQAEKNAAMAAWSSLKQCKWLASVSVNTFIIMKRYGTLHKLSREYNSFMIIIKWNSW